MSDTQTSQIQNASSSPEYTSGGDITLCSSDGLNFSVHTLLLSMASPVFADMFEVGSQDAVVNLTENAEMLTLMLGFIYPRPSPPITSFEAFDSAFRIADKYGLDAMTLALRDRLSNPNSPVSIHSDPLQGLVLASAHGFTSETTLAVSSVNSTFDFCKVEDLLKLAESMPVSRLAIKLASAPSVRSTILTDVLFQYHKSPMSDSVASNYYVTCDLCSKRGVYSPPDWKAIWANSAFQELVRRPIEKCEHVFRFQFLQMVIAQSSGQAMKTCDCMRVILQDTRCFENWAARVRSGLDKRLAVLDQLNPLA